jgi:ADP-heptose:LPS heptosyltransferase
MLQQAALYLGHDSGITHLAAMMGVPTIAMFRDTDPRQWRPLGPRVAVVGAQTSGSALMEEVVRAARVLLQENTR